MRHYGQSACSQGNREDILLCVAQCQERWVSYQCSRKRGHGPDGLYCKQHAKMIAAGRNVYVPPDKQ